MQTWIHLIAVFKIVYAFVLGGVIGWERERRGMPAGIRTFGAIAMGSCLFGLVSLMAPWPADPSRIASQVVIGVGFIGAGIFFRQGDYITGLTTAATLWTSAAIGLAVAFDLYLLGLLTTAILLMFLVLPRLTWWPIVSKKAKRARK